MTVFLQNCPHPRYHGEGVEPIHLWISPDERYAVAEVFCGEYFAAGPVAQRDTEAGRMTIRCIDCFSAETDEVDLHIYSVDWSPMPNGFCKLCCRSLERAEPRTFRIYFDPDTYIRRYEERSGVPYHGEKRFKQGR